MLDFDCEMCVFKSTVAENASPELFEILSKLELNSIIKRIGIVKEAEPEINNSFFENITIKYISTVAELNSFLADIKKADKIACHFSFSDKTGIAEGSHVAYMRKEDVGHYKLERRRKHLSELGMCVHIVNIFVTVFRLYIRKYFGNIDIV